MLVLVAASKSQPVVGVSLGILIGLVTGAAFLLILKTIFKADKGISEAIQIIAETFSIPTFWFGGPYFTGQILGAVDPNAIRSSYMVALLITFILISTYPLFRLVRAIGREI